jgi:Lipase (class 3)
MWRVAGVRPDERGAGGAGWLAGDPFSVQSLDGEPVDAARVRLLLEQAGVERTEKIPETLWADAERDDADTGLHAIDSWAERAVEEERGEFHVVGSDDWAPFVLLWPEGRSAAWHDMTVALIRVPAGYDSVHLEYEREPADTDRAAPFLDKFQRARKADFVDWRFYVGEDTPAVDGESLATRISRTRWRAGIRLGGLAGTLVARFANWRGPVAPVGGDPSWAGRLRRSEREYPAAARDFPPVEDALANHERCVIYVHGTMSSALPALDAVRDIIGTNVVRYEHDTFLSIRHNANRLANLITDRHLAPRDLTLVGHSRGGLVARLAAAEVLKRATRPLPDRISVLTFGTPHRGTPLVGQTLVDFTPIMRAALLAIGLVADAQGRVWRDLPSTAWRYLLCGRPVPEGLLEMAPGDLLLSLIEDYASNVNTDAYGGACDLGAVPSGAKLAFFQSLGKGLFEGPNDFVVGQRSATAVGTGKPMGEPCAHFDYFLKDEVRQALQRIP